MALTILGSTGSIGRQTLEVAEDLGLPVCALAAGRSVKLLEEQVRKFRPKYAVLYDEAAARDLRTALGDTETKVLSGMEGLLEAAQMPEADTVLGAMSGSAGLRPALAAAEAGKRLALANKETLVCAGRLLLAAVDRSGAELIPVDSEHSAIFQCLNGNPPPRRILLTASGGPFRDFSPEELKTVTPEMALKHPNWTMGPKVTVDSSTLMNKGLEFIEAMHLFRVKPEQIRVLIHPQSIVHSMVEFADGAILAQLGSPDMRLPIQLALTWPERCPSIAAPLDPVKAPPLTFRDPDTARFPCLAIAMEAAGHDNADCAVMNAANEIAVAAFLDRRLSYMGIPALVERVMAALPGLPGDSLEAVEAADSEARRCAEACLSSIS
jgi:1-deoxy-D-xylulose-5-phosphate reductoisomerase